MTRGQARKPGGGSAEFTVPGGGQWDRSHGSGTAADISASEPRITEDNRNRARIVAAAAIAASLIASGSTVMIAARREDARYEAVETAVVQCADAAEIRPALARQTIEAEELLRATEGQVVDEAARETLAAAIAAAHDIGVAPVDIDRSMDRTMAQEVAEACVDITTRAPDVSRQMAEASSAVVMSHAQWLLEQAQSQADVAIDAAAATLGETEGRVSDNTTRQELAAAIEAAQAARNAKPGKTPQEIQIQLDAIANTLGTVFTKQQAVSESTARWQEEQAARQAEAQRRAQQQTPAPRQSQLGKTNQSSGGNTGSGGGGGSNNQSIQGGTGPNGKTPTHNGGDGGGAQTG